MTCPVCSATIADKAIVCYRCGTATAVPNVAEKAPAPIRRPWGMAAALLALAMGSAAGFEMQPFGPWHMVFGSFGAVMGSAGLYLLVGPRRR